MRPSTLEFLTPEETSIFCQQGGAHLEPIYPSRTGHHMQQFRSVFLLMWLDSSQSAYGPWISTK
jgi:hypothetical protein